MKKIDAIIFDFGGVLFRIDPRRTIKELLRYSSQADKLLNAGLELFLTAESFILYEKGEMSSSEFRDALRKNMFLTASDIEIDSAWNKTLLEINPDAISIVKKCKESAPVFLLSNTNELHYYFFRDECAELFALFEKRFFSHELGMKKPEPEIYTYVLKEINGKPQNTLFIDDSIENIKAAEKLGLQTFHVNDKNTLSLVPELFLGV